MRGLQLVKLGGSLITDKSTPYTVERETLDRLCGEVHQARQEAGDLPLVLAHGAGSFGHVTAARYGTHRGIQAPGDWRGFAEVNRDAARLDGMVHEALTRAGAVAVPLQPSAACVTRGGRISRYEVEPVRRLLQAGVIPLLYGDAVVDQERGCAIASTEEILRHLAAELAPERVLMVGKVDGVLGQDGELIREITRDSFDRVRRALHPSDGVADVTGGMLQKVQMALAFGVPAEIINGTVPGLLQRALSGERGLGTTITPD